MAVSSADETVKALVALTAFFTCLFCLATCRLTYNVTIKNYSQITFPTHNESATYTLTEDELDKVREFKITLVKERE